MDNKETFNEVLQIQKKLQSLAKKRTKMSGARTYMNAERTLSVWIRTALSSMIFGIAIDKYGLMLRRLPQNPQTILHHASATTTWIGTILVSFSVIIALTAGIRFLQFSSRFKQEFPIPYHHKAWLPVSYALITVLFGTGLFIMMWWV